MNITDFICSFLEDVGFEYNIVNEGDRIIFNLKGADDMIICHKSSLSISVYADFILYRLDQPAFTTFLHNKKCLSLLTRYLRYVKKTIKRRNK